MHIITAITGASGAIYGLRFIQLINKLNHQQSIIITEPGKKVISHELKLSADIEGFNNKPEVLKDGKSWGLTNPELVSFFDNNNIEADIASGSRVADAMVIIPATMGTIARINQGLSSCLLERAFDVMLKENKKLIVVPRETPFNQIHLKNLLGLSQLGIDIIPAMPAFYQHPQSIMELVDFIVGRVLEHLSIEHSLYQKWQGKSNQV